MVAIDCSIKVVGRESVDGPWMDKFILPLHVSWFVSDLSGPWVEEVAEGGTTGL